MKDHLWFADFDGGMFSKGTIVVLAQTKKEARRRMSELAKSNGGKVLVSTIALSLSGYFIDEGHD